MVFGEALRALAIAVWDELEFSLEETRLNLQNFLVPEHAEFYCCLGPLCIYILIGLPCDL